MSERDSNGLPVPFTVDRDGCEVLTARTNVPSGSVLLSMGNACLSLTVDEATTLGVWLSNAANDVRAGFPFRNMRWRDE